VIGSIPVGGSPNGVAITPDGSKVYIANATSNTVSVIDTATNTVVSTIPVGSGPDAFGIFIAPILGPSFAGTPGSPNCQGTSVSALVTKFGGLDAAAAALGSSNVLGLQNAIRAFCAG
jgi:YVTN family beta-propeller protein